MTRHDPIRTGPDGDPAAAAQVVSLSLFRFRSLADRAWAFAQMGLARRPLRRLPDVGFVKLMGAGTGEGFTPIPDTGAVAILTTWPDLDTACTQLDDSAVLRRYRARAEECWTLHLSPSSVRGAWAGACPFRASGAPIRGPVAALTRATLRPRALLRFWRRVPAISRAIGSDPAVIFKIGVGEIPWVNQMTFSIWPDSHSMAAFARADGPHARAIRAVRDGDWFAEELYARFAILATDGRWGGRDPLAPLRPAAE